MFDSVKQLALRVSPGGFIRFFARPYLAGFSIDDAFRVAAELQQQRQLLSTIDLLGEEATAVAAVARMKGAYLELIGRMARFERFAELSTRPTVSLKLSGLVEVRYSSGGGLDVDRARLIDSMLEVAQAARECHVALTIDMEDHRWTDITLDVYRAVRAAGHDHVGTVLQSRLLRTPGDIEALPDAARIRLVIGVYLEPAAIALVDKAAMKEQLLMQTRRLLERGATVELATHDEGVIERFFREIVIPEHVAPERYEIQMLLGVPRQKLQNALVAGSAYTGVGPVKVRLYVPFALSATDGTAYCRRRLIENPDMVTYGLRNMLGRLGSGSVG
jgi:proline dehydrogenase